MTFMEWVGVIGMISTVISTIYAILAHNQQSAKTSRRLGRENKQLIAENKKLKEMNNQLISDNARIQNEEEERCLARCQELTDRVAKVRSHLNVACRVVENICTMGGKKCAPLITAVHTANDRVGDIIDFCRVLNTDHKSRFDYFIFDDFGKEFEKRACLDYQEEDRGVLN